MKRQHGHRRRKPALVVQVLGGSAVLVAAFALTASAGWRTPAHDAAMPAQPVVPGPGSAMTEPVHSTFDRSAHSTTDPGSIWVIVNKTHPIADPGFRPSISLVRGYQVAEQVVEPLGRLLDDADARGLGFKIASAFRSYEYQQHVHDGLVAANGEAAADQVSARPGHSEHQTGLAVDLVTPADPACDFEQCFADTAGGRWLAEDSWRYGFVVRYQRGGSAVTGYAPEPWHLRYVGLALAAEMHRTGIATLEEFFDVPGGPYPRR